MSHRLLQAWGHASEIVFADAPTTTPGRQELVRLPDLRDWMRGHCWSVHLKLRQ